MWSRIKGWSERNLSMAGREVLIKSVLQAIPTYVMSCFLLTQSILQEAEKIIRLYWWGSQASSGISWLSWKNFCRPKGEGGMGFYNLESFNLPLFAKQGWRIITEPNLLHSQILKARYFPGGTFFNADVGECPSVTWRSIVTVRSCLMDGVRIRIGNGQCAPM